MNWEDKIKEEEAKHIAIFEKQKQAIMNKKLAEQNAELILASNKGTIDQMKEEHQKALQALETAIEIEQARQMNMMKEKLRERMMDNEQEKVRREVRMAMLMKQKELK